MLAVTRLRPKRVDRHTVIELYLNGSYDACLSACHNDEDASGSAIRARALIRLRRYQNAIEVLDRDVRECSNSVRGEFSSLRSLCFALLGRYDEARDAQRDARAYIYSINAPALEAELHVNEAKLCLMQGDAARARRIADEIFETPDLFVASDGRLTTVATAKAEAGNLLCMLDLSDDDRISAVRHLIIGIEALAATHYSDVGLTARLLANLSGCYQGVNRALERNSMSLVREVYKSITWTDDLRDHRFHISRELGLASALEGDHLSAFREYKVAYNVAPNRPSKILALLDRIFLGKELKQTLVAHADLLDAHELAKTVDWSCVDERDVYCLLPLTSLLAPIDPGGASWALRIYEGRKSKATGTSSQFSDQIIHGEYLIARAAVARCEARWKDADRALSSAFDIFHTLGVRWRAAQVAFEMQDTAERHRQYARQEAEHYPKSWLASKLFQSSSA